MVSGLNAIDKMVMFGGWGLRRPFLLGFLGYLSDGILSLACCLEIALQSLHPLLSLGDQGFISKPLEVFMKSTMYTMYNDFVFDNLLSIFHSNCWGV